MNLTAIETVTINVLNEVLKVGTREFCICPGVRNAPLIEAIKAHDLKMYSFFDERSAAFFALGRSQNTRRPVAVIVTSGTAGAHLLAAAMQCYYAGIPLILITADRPRRFRHKNSPQGCEQKIFMEFILRWL